MLIGRTNTILYCRRWAESVAFYRDTIELISSFENDWFVEFEVTAGSYLSVADAARATIEPSGGAGITISWQVADVDAIRHQLLARGVAVSPSRSRWGASTVFLHDPEGTRIELWSPV